MDNGELPKGGTVGYPLLLHRSFAHFMYLTKEAGGPEGPEEGVFPAQGAVLQGGHRELGIVESQDTHQSFYDERMDLGAIPMEVNQLDLCRSALCRLLSEM